MAILHSLLVADSLAVAGHADHVRPLILGRCFDVIFETFEEFRMHRFIVKALLNRAGTGYHRRYESVFPERGPVILAHQVPAGQPHLYEKCCRLLGIQAGPSQTAATDGLFDTSILHDFFGLAPHNPGQSRQHRRSTDKPCRDCENLAACNRAALGRLLNIQTPVNTIHFISLSIIQLLQKSTPPWTSDASVPLLLILGN